MFGPQCFDCQFLLTIIDTNDIRCKAFLPGVPDKILQVGDCIQFKPVVTERSYQDPEFHHFAVKLRRLHREIITSEKLSDEDASLASDALMAWAAGRLPKDWIRERKINAAEAQRLKDAGVWPW
jgi:hypothetical protein